MSFVRTLFSLSAVVAISQTVFAEDATYPEGVSVTVDFLPEECEEKSSVGQTLEMHYTGSIDESSATGEGGKVFDSSVGKAAFTFPLGGGQVIKGWDVGLVGMCVGEKRTLVLAPDFGYGDRGAGGDIPGGATLKFTVELVGIGAAGEQPEQPNLFAEIDADKNAELTEEEIGAWFKKTMDKEIPDGLMEKEDANNDKVVSWEEFSGPKGTDPRDEL
eukprot:m.233876 g.233876  ORF g.233876 m.233876 type:complete len:217 (+) comp33649_c8_seq3:43-693(+)